MRAHLLISPLPLQLPPTTSSSIPFRSLVSPRRTKTREKAVGLHVARCSSRPPNSNDPADSNAETWTTAGRFRFRNGGTAGDYGFSGERRGPWSWWSDDGADQLDQDEEEVEEVFEQDPRDAFWIFKVFKSFGWLLPPIIISTLVATGPKAFLVALALPLGQSALSFAADKLWGKPQANQRNRATKAKKKKKPFAQRAYYTRSTQMGEEEEEEDDVKVIASEVRRISHGRRREEKTARQGRVVAGPSQVLAGGMNLRMGGVQRLGRGRRRGEVYWEAGVARGRGN